LTPFAKFLHWLPSAQRSQGTQKNVYKPFRQEETFSREVFAFSRAATLSIPPMACSEIPLQLTKKEADARQLFHHCPKTKMEDPAVRRRPSLSKSVPPNFASYAVNALAGTGKGSGFKSRCSACQRPVLSEGVEVQTLKRMFQVHSHVFLVGVCVR